MTKVEPNKYLVLIRDDYLYGLGQLSGTRLERDELIQQAVQEFLDEVPFESRKQRIRQERARVRLTRAADQSPPYRMYLESVHISDNLVIRMDKENRYPSIDAPIYDALGSVLNAAIKVYLDKARPNYMAK
ncbi:hypothetical protein ACFL2Q_08085 [Thermodesulfobacteriota bacterium]